MKRSKLLAMAAGIGLALGSFAQAASISVFFHLNDSSGTPITPDSTDHYTVASGSNFQVVLVATVNSPNLTEASGRNASNNSKPLGIQNLSVNILTPATVGIAVPISASGQWQNYSDLTTDGLGVASVNVLDKDSDTDLDVAQAGILNNTLSLATNANATALRKVSYGAVGATDVAGPLELVLGDYHLNSGLPVTITAQGVVANVFRDPDSSENSNAAALAVTDVLSTLDIHPIFINVPEPTTVGMLGLGLLGLAARRRRTV